jgi:hypothetical protein
VTPSRDVTAFHQTAVLLVRAAPATPRAHGERNVVALLSGTSLQAYDVPHANGLLAPRGRGRPLHSRVLFSVMRIGVSRPPNSPTGTAAPSRAIGALGPFTPWEGFCVHPSVNQPYLAGPSDRCFV